jgi:hypothetical protein
MKNIKKFEEYKFEYDDDIATEYTKLIVSKYIDKKNEETLESVYYDVVKGDDLDEDQAYIIKNTMQVYLYNLYLESKDIKTIIGIEANKYNI